MAFKVISTAITKVIFHIYLIWKKIINNIYESILGNFINIRSFNIPGNIRLVDSFQFLSRNWRSDWCETFFGFFKMVVGLFFNILKYLWFYTKQGVTGAVDQVLENWRLLLRLLLHSHELALRKFYNLQIKLRNNSWLHIAGSY